MSLADAVHVVALVRNDEVDVANVAVLQVCIELVEFQPDGTGYTDVFWPVAAVYCVPKIVRLSAKNSGSERAVW